MAIEPSRRTRKWPYTASDTFDWDEIDHAIYDHRIRLHKTWREVGEAVGLSFTTCRQRFYKCMERVTPAEVEDMRTEENMRLDDIERKLVQAAELAGEAGDFNNLLKAIKEVHAVHRSRSQLNGLPMPVRAEINVTFDELNSRVDEALNAYLQGAADASNNTGTASRTDT